MKTVRNKREQITKSRAGMAVLVMVVMLVGFFAGGSVYAQGYYAPPSGIQSLENMQNTFRGIAQQVIPTVVEVDVVDVVKTAVLPQNPFEFFFGPQTPGGNKDSQPQQKELKQYGLGSGVMVRRDGNKVYVLTNNHVVGQANEITVKFPDGRQFDANLVGSDERKDLALIVFKTKEQVPIANLGNSDNLQVGDWVLAIGNPLGFSSSITSGIVSALGRNAAPGMESSGFTDYIQTDASINQGNSGGALVNLHGEVVGINTWIASNSGGSIGLGFSIPINVAKQDIDKLINNGKIDYGWLGASIGGLPTAYSEGMNLSGTDGAFIYNIFKGSPADKAGIVPGDFVTALNGTTVKDSNQLLQMIGNFSPGERASFDIIRGGKNLSLTATIAPRAAEEEIAKQSAKIWPGMFVAGLNEEIRKSLSLPATVNGVLIASVEKGSPSDIAGLQQGDVIERIGNKNIKSMPDFYSEMNTKKGSELNFRIYRQGVELMVGLIA